LPETQETEVDSVVGAFMLVRREALEAAGLLDESFFMYGEDLDWAFRIKQAGWKIWYYPDVIVYHYKGAASRGNVRARKAFYEAMAIFVEKHYKTQTNPLLYAAIRAGIQIKGSIDVTRTRIQARKMGGKA
jgi:GT2 family glycosyltransferase